MDKAVFIPNVFSPNGDEQNDLLTMNPVAGQNMKLVTFKVYDRLGNQVHQIQDIEFDDEIVIWDGNRSETELRDGVYVYTVKLEYEERLIQFYGNITIVK